MTSSATISKDQSKEVEAAIPYFVFQKHHEDDILIISTLSRTLQSEDIQDARQGAVVYGDIITLDRYLALNGRSLTIHARIIRTEGDSVIETSGKEAALGYSGERAAPHQPNTQPGDNGQAGTDGGHGLRGQDAGSLTLVAQKLDLSKGGLTLRANGANGQNGQHGGAGSDGVKGKDGDKKEDFWGAYKNGTKGQNGGKGGDGGLGGNAGRGGSGGVITVCTVEPVDANRLMMVANAGSDGQPGTGGAAGVGMPGGKGGTTWKSVEKSFWEKLFTSSASRHKLVDGPDEPDGDNGKNGEDGTEGTLVGSLAVAGSCSIGTLVAQDFLGRLTVTGSGTTIEDYAAQSYLAPNLDQLYLAMGKAKRLYLSAEGRKSFEETLELLAWIYYVTPTSEESQQRLALARQVAAMQIDPAVLNPQGMTQGVNAEDDRRLETGRRLRELTGFARHCVAEAAEGEALHIRAGVLLCQLSEGLDFYGHAWNWAPIIQIDPLVEHANRLISAAQSVESLFLGYQQKAAEQDKWQAQMNATLDEHEKLVREAGPALTQAIEERQRIEQDYPMLARDVFAKEAELRAACDAFLQDLKQALLIDAGKDFVKTAAAIYTAGSGVTEAWTVASAAMQKVKEREPAKVDPPAEPLAAPIKHEKPIEIEMVPLRRSAE